MANDSLEIRLADVADTKAIADVIREAFEPLKAEYTAAAFEAVTPDTQEVAGRFAEGPTWVALLDGDLVATVSTVVEPDRLYIRSMAVSPLSQGRGIGRRLIGVIEAHAAENRFERLYLYTTLFLSGAISLYESCGFARVRETTGEEWHGVPGLAMEKKIGRNIKQNVVGS